MKGKIIDFHTHAFPDKVAGKVVEQLASHYKLPVTYSGELEELLDYAKRDGVAKIVLHAAATKASQVQTNNDWISGVICEEIVGFGSLHPEFVEVEAELERMMDLGLTGIKFHPEFQGVDLLDSRMWKIYEAIGDRFPVMFHVGDAHSQLSAPHKLAKILDAFPNMTVIGAHLGGFAAWAESERYIIGRELYVDTSSAVWLMSPQEATRLIRQHGVHKVLFGTDYPICTAQEELDRLDKLDLTHEEKEMILWKNAEELLARFPRNRQTVQVNPVASI